MTNTIRVWRSIVHLHCEWHVSIGDETRLANLRRYAVDNGLLGETHPDERLGMAWDEALGEVSMAMIAPTGLRRSVLSMEPPAGAGWELILEIRCVGVGVFDLESRERRWDLLELGEALASFVQLTYPKAWGGFQSERTNGFALQVITTCEIDARRSH